MARKIKRRRYVPPVDPLWGCSGCAGDFGLWLSAAQIRELGL